MKLAFSRFTLPKLALTASALALATSQAVAQRPIGVDVSSYQGQPNWGSIHGAGISFAWAKATQGTTVNDPDYSYNNSNGKANGVFMGAYDFSEPALNTPSAEASHFWSIAGGNIRADGKSFQPMIDVETFNGVDGASSYSAWVNAWCSAITSDGAGVSANVNPVIYISACNACELNGSVAGHPAWIANYNGENIETGNPWNVCGSCDVWGAGVWTVWQYTSTGSVPGISGAVDRDVYNGNVAGLVIGSKVTTPTNRVGMARTHDGQGYWIVASDGGVFSEGDAPFYGSMGGHPLAKPVVAMAARPQGDGYWLVGADGGVFSFGAAAYYGGMAGQTLGGPIVGICSTADGAGYWLVGSDGGIYSFGDAPFHGSMGGQHLNAPVVGMASTPGNGYWLVGSDGGIFSFSANYYGSMGGQHLNAPIVGIAPNTAGTGYWLVGSDGGIFSFGSVGFYGSMGGHTLAQPVCGLAASVDAAGYWEVAKDGGIFSFGDAPYKGGAN